MRKILFAGGAGMVGHSLLKVMDHYKFQITVVDKDAILMKKLRSQFPNIKLITLDLSDSEAVKKIDMSFDCVVIMQAQIKGLKYMEFHQNSGLSTQNLINCMNTQNCKPYLIHISSSVINSKADDFYTRSKRQQEQLITGWVGKKLILRPTLMYGEGDNKHFYVLLNIMRKLPFFPLPGKGKYIRQPLYAMDFARVINECIENPREGFFNISGLEYISFKDCLLKFKHHYEYFVLFIPIPILLFRWTLKLGELITKKVPFTEQQLDALIIPETFERIDWPTIFNTNYTKFEDGIKAFDYKFK